MADFLDDRIIVLIVIMVIFFVVILVEFWYLRKRRASKAKKEPLEDQAFNAVLNARAISNTLARDGTDLSGVNDILDRADAALQRGDFRGSLDLTDRAKEMMKTVKAKSDVLPETKGGDFAETEPTTKEVLRKKFPNNYLESRFSRSMAAESIQKAKDSSLDISEAERLLQKCDECADREDYTQALSYAVRSRKLAEDAVGGAGPKGTAAGSTCSSCGAEVLEDDAFCRKCGAKAEIVCNECGKKPQKDDVFCRACGSSLES